MKTVSNEVDKKLQDANKFADEKRGELVQVSSQTKMTISLNK